MISGSMAVALRNAGYQVFETGDGEEALELIQTHPDRPVDLMITDMLMPRIGGNELVSRLQSLLPDLRILLCSGHPMEKVVQEDSWYGKMPFLKKPFTVTTFLEEVNKALGTARSSFAGIDPAE
jgi:DNA-binding NtrC family response regulator